MLHPLSLALSRSTRLGARHKGEGMHCLCICCSSFFDDIRQVQVGCRARSLKSVTRLLPLPQGEGVDYPDTCRSSFFDDIRQVQVGCRAHSFKPVTCLLPLPPGEGWGEGVSTRIVQVFVGALFFTGRVVIPAGSNRVGISDTQVFPTSARPAPGIESCQRDRPGRLPAGRGVAIPR